MKEQDIIDWLPEYLDGTLSDDKKQVVEAHIQQNESIKQAYEEIKVLFQAFEDHESSEPTPLVRENFFAQIEEEKKRNPKIISLQKKKSVWATPLKIAAGLALLFGAFQLGNYQAGLETDQKIAVLEIKQDEIKQTAMLSLMENQSASKRILGVNYIEELSKPDEAIIKALSERMLHDENVNVRLTAAEALSRFSGSEDVKNAFVAALRSEKDPAIQITIIHILVSIQEKKAASPMRELLKKEETQPFVKKEIESLLPNII